MEKKIISINELSEREIRAVIETALDLKKKPLRYARRLEKKVLFLLFQKTSTRTRMAFELGMRKLGGSSIVMDWEKSNFSISPLTYEARYVDGMVDCVLARLVKNEDVLVFARSISVPFINGCCDMYHPSQALADLLTIYEAKGSFKTSLVYVGIQNNVANSLFYACTKAGVHLIFVAPLKDRVPPDFNALKSSAAGFEETLDLESAVSRSEFVYTDTWINMEHFHDAGRREENERRMNTMMKFQISRKLIEGRNIFIMHDMPVHPGLEIDDYAINAPNSLIFQQAKNRMYAGQALLLHLLDAV